MKHPLRRGPSSPDPDPLIPVYLLTYPLLPSKDVSSLHETRTDLPIISDLFSDDLVRHNAHPFLRVLNTH